VAFDCAGRQHQPLNSDSGACLIAGSGWAINGFMHLRWAAASVAGAKRNVGGGCAGAQIGEPAALHNWTVTEKPVQVLVATLAGKGFIDRPGRYPRSDRQSMLQIILAQKSDHFPMLIVEINTFAFCQCWSESSARRSLKWSR
jgi:hypothetical protein